MQSNDLIDFIGSASRQISEEYDRIQKRATEDPGTAGDQGEENWATLLRNCLPPTFQIVTKGRILSHEGVASPQVDVLVLQPEYPKQLLDKKLYLAGGILAAFECKVTLKAKHIEDLIKNSVEIKSHAEIRKGSPYKELQSPIIYGLLAHSHSWKGENSTPTLNVESQLFEADSSFITHPIQMPDILCIADLECWSSSKTVFVAAKGFAQLIQNNRYEGQVLSVSSYIGRTRLPWQRRDNYTSIGEMLISLYRKIAWEYPNLRQLSRYFTLTKIAGSGQGGPRIWLGSIFSDEVREKIELRQPRSGVFWDEWDTVIH